MLHYTNPGIRIFYKSTAFLVLYLFFISTSFAQQNIPLKTDSIKAKRKNSFLIFPIIGNTPETSWMFGLASVYVFKTNRRDSVLRTSNVSGGVIYSLNNQIVVGLGGNIYLPKERYVIIFDNNFSRFPDKFWGLGNNSLESNVEGYSFTQLYLNPQLHKNIYKKIFLGAAWEYQQLFKITHVTGGLFDQQKVLGVSDRSEYNISGYGLFFTYDTRNHAYSPDKGWLAEIRFGDFHRETGSDYDYRYIKLDFRKFIKTYKKHVLAFQLSGLFNFGDVPFRSLAVIGGEKVMRGYYAGRFRDQKFLGMQTEYRFPIIWRFGGVVFAGIGQVANQFKEYNDIEKFKVSAGLGVRFALLPKEKLNLRFDLAVGNYNSINYYLTVSEAF